MPDKSTVSSKMEYQPLKKRIHPRETANFLSIATFCYAIGDFIRGFKKDLDEEDLYQAVTCCTSTALADRAEREWKEESKKEKPSIVRMILRLFGKEYALMGLANFVLKTVLLVLRPILLGKLLKFFSPNNTDISKEEVYAYGIALIGITFLSSMYLHGYMFLISQLGLRMRISFCSLIYRKSLKLSPESLNKISNGNIVTLVSKDVFAFDSAIMFFHDIWIGVIQIVVMTYVMYLQIDWTAFVGITFLVSLIPLQMYLASMVQNKRLLTNAKADERVRLIQEILVSIKIIKMYVWEKFFNQKTCDTRKAEMKKIRLIFFLKTIIFSTGALATRLSFYLCMLIYLTYYNALTAEQAFIVVGSYSALRQVITVSIPIGCAQIAEAKSSFKRIKKVLMAQEMEKVREAPVDVKPEIELKNCRVEIGPRTVLDIDKFQVKSGFVGLTGPVGCGKSTFLKLILKDTIIVQGNVTANGKLSYASQEPWLFPGTIKQNIIFGEEIDEQRYQKIIQICALNSDLENFPQGDQLVVMDKGSNLSKGQQARVNLARAIYRNADIYLLDDSLSSLDAHVSRYIFNTAIRQFLSDKIVVFVSHQKNFLKEADRVVVLENGKISKDVTSTEIDNIKLDASAFQDFDEKSLSLDEDFKFTDNEDAALLQKPQGGIYSEKNKEGGVDFKVYKRYFIAGGGLKSVIMIVFVFLLAQISASWFDFFISKWVDSQQEMATFELKNETNNVTYLDLKTAHESSMISYSILITAATLLTLAQSFMLFYCTGNASKNLHKKCFSAVIDATMTFFDCHLSGNIVNRFSRDIGTIDELLPFVLFECIRVTFVLVGVLFLVCSTNITFIAPFAVTLVILYLMKVVYIRTGRSLKRLENATRSPVVGHINSSLEGLSTIRGSKAEAVLTIQFDKYQDINSSSSYMFITQSRAFGFFMDMISGVLVAFIILTFLIWDNSAMAGKVGLAITQAFMLTGLLQWGIRQWAELENCMTCVERVSEYTKAEKEKKLTNTAAANWPSNGKIVFDQVTMRYSKSVQPVLKQVSFTLNPGEKLGIIGRTGAGKSSIISALFKLYDIQGNIKIDDVNITLISPEILRKKISIIPQDPLLFVGTIRDNLDPFREYTDLDLWNALDVVEMKPSIDSLAYLIKENGVNFSAGQKQLICLARAILRNNKILILDEATANVDPKTDLLIQNIIKEKFSHCTKLIVAHKLENVLHCNKIMVLNRGSVMELDSPKVLLGNKDGVFYNMAKQAGILSEETKDKNS